MSDKEDLDSVLGKESGGVRYQKAPQRESSTPRQAIDTSDVEVGKEDEGEPSPQAKPQASPTEEVPTSPEEEGPNGPTYEANWEEEPPQLPPSSPDAESPPLYEGG
ncbi:MAG: hypothetical protein KDK60_02895, partial [Chlamydiia bacterium]|nr:hypothetical protein [Chlamydiia bacterium]